MSAKTAQSVLVWFVKHIYDLLSCGKRDPQQVEDVLQLIKDFPDFHGKFFLKNNRAFVEPRLKLVPVPFVSATIAGDISSLFKDAKRFYRDGSLDKLLKGALAAVGDRIASTLEIVQPSKIVQMVEEILDVSGKTPDELEAEFVGRGLGLSPAQAEGMLLASTDKSNPFGLQLNGSANLFLVVHNGHLVILRARWDDSRWYVFAYGFGFALEWHAGRRVVVGNSL